MVIEVNKDIDRYQESDVYKRQKPVRITGR